MKSKTQISARLALHRRIENIADLAEEQAAGSAYVIYAILDTKRPDPLGKFRALPIYIGVTGQIGRRVKQHFRRAAKNQFGRNRICIRLRRMLIANVVAEFEVVDHLDNKIDAMIAETVHAQRLLRAGYTLCNQWYFQREILTEWEMQKVIARIWRAAETVEGE
jgi:predicted GIY-YIG superfamily endonuclease